MNRGGGGGGGVVDKKKSHPPPPLQMPYNQGSHEYLCFKQKKGNHILEDETEGERKANL